MAKERFLKVKSMVAEYNDIGDKAKINRDSMILSPISVKDIILLPFTSNIRSRHHDLDVKESIPMLNNVDQKKVNAYLSTPRFIKYLTDISELISKEQDKKGALKRELRKLNQHLPASVYIPFCQDSIRNYAVLHIHPEEVHVFQTASRCPYMITIEMYRPDEMSTASVSYMEKKKSEPRKHSETFVKKRSRIDSIELSDNEDPLLLIEQTDDIFNTQRRKSRSVYQAPTDKIEFQAEEKISKPLFISFIGDRPEVGNTLKNTQKDIKTATKKVKRFMLDDVTTPRTSEMEESDETFEKRSRESKEEDKEDDKNLNYLRKSSYDEESSLEISNHGSPSPFNNNLKLVKAKTGEIPKIKSKDTSLNASGKDHNNSDDDSSYYSKNNLKNILDQRDEEEISFTRKSRGNIISIKEPTNFLFKETFEQQNERMRSASIFGSLKTWKIIKMIVKSGDDLRQEQFAMQIIDLMTQIFKVSGVG